jgi:hypothetical protein
MTFGFAQDLAATAAETQLSQADVIRQSLKLGLPALGARLGKSRRGDSLWSNTLNG